MLSIFTTILLNVSIGQSYQVYNGDTINKVDESNFKQGHWIYFGNMTNLPEYKSEQKVEEGKFQDNRKDGLWVKYFPNEKIQSEITFSNNRPNGEYKIYYDNGQLQEQGLWKNNRNTGAFKRYHDNGQPQQEFVFNEGGKRDGTQKYFHENGQLMIIGDIKEGKETGEFKEYFANGDLKSVKVFDEAGVLNAEKSKDFESVKPEVKIVESKPDVPEKTTTAVVVKEEKANEALNVFNGEGQWTLYNKNKQVSQKGFFKGGRLKDGEKYVYDKDGILTTIEKYKGFKYIGDGVIEEEKK